MRSKLFVPGDRPERFESALSGDADMVSVDLEDTVTVNRKGIAREAVRKLLDALGPTDKERVLVRVNALDSGLLQADLEALVGRGVALLNLPKPQSPEEIIEVSSLLGDLEKRAGVPQGTTRILINVETPMALRRVYDLAQASSRVSGIQIGYADLLEPYGIDREFGDALNHIRMTVRMACAELDIECYDGVYAGVDNDEFFEREAVICNRMGFSGKSCFNEAQVAIANRVFRPPEHAIAKARRIVAASESAFARGEGIFIHEGRIVDAPFVAGARRILALAAAANR